MTSTSRPRRERPSPTTSSTSEGKGPGPIFQSRDGRPMLRKDADRYLKQIAAMANANVPEEERVNLHAHLMRHTALKQAEQKFGRAFAQKKSGNVGMQHIERYVQPLSPNP